MKISRTRKQGRRSTDSALAEIREDERTHISRELHDDIGQLLATLRVDLTLLKQLPAGAPEAAPLMDSMDALLLNAIGSLRRIAGNLRPRALDGGGLHYALKALQCEFEKRHRIGCRLDVHAGLPLLHERYSTAIYRLVQESLTNIARHAGAQCVQIRLAHANGELCLEISDDGRGIAAGDMEKPHALGLLGMRERVASLRGDIVVAGDSMGTRITIRIPLPASAAACDSDGCPA